MEEIDIKKCGDELDEIMLNVSMNMKRLRREKSVTQNDVAYCIGSDKSVISSIESGAVRNVKLYTLIKIAQVLDTTIHELIL